MTGTYLTLIADYGGRSGGNDLAFAEVSQKLYEKIDNIIHMDTLSVNAFNTVETAFVVSELALNSKLKNHVVYHNTAPRKDDINPRANNAGEFLAFCVLPSGVKVIGVYSGYSFSFLKDFAKIYKVKCSERGSQFRSRDVFPDMVASLAAFDATKGEKWEFQDEEIIDVPSVPDNVLLFADGYGNMKTSIVLNGDVAENTKFAAEVNGIKAVVSYGAGIFSVADGEFVLAKGSSGWDLPDGGRRKFFEISKRGGNAVAHFDYALPGSKIVLNSVAE